MAPATVLSVSDPQHTGPAEQARRGYELACAPNWACAGRPLGPRLTPWATLCRNSVAATSAPGAVVEFSNTLSNRVNASPSGEKLLKQFSTTAPRTPG